MTGTDPRSVFSSTLAALKARLAAGAEASRIEFGAGLRLHSPCTSTTYRGIWPDDFLWPLLVDESLEDTATLARTLEFITASVVDLPRVPDRIEPDGMPVMQPGALSAPHAECMPLHLPAAWVRLLDVLHTRGLAIPRKAAWAGVIARSFDQVPFSCGLAYVDPQRPGAGFGFHDPCAITGFELMSSLVLYRGLQRAAVLFADAAPADTIRRWSGLARAIRDNLHRLWSPEEGAYLAGSKDCRQVNVWANGLAYGIASPEQKNSIVAWYRRHREQIFRHGCTRQVAEPGGWQRQLVDIPVGTYTNGGFWPTGTGFVLPAVADQDPVLAAEVAAPLIATLERTRDAEWVSADGTPGGARGFLAALSMPCLALRCILEGKALLDAF
jgi:hypothetical protein